MKPIFSDDPQAIQKLQKKLELLEAHQKHMKEINQGYKKYGADWVKDKVSAETYWFYIKDSQYSFNKRKFYPSWALSNNNAVIRTAKKRLQKLLKEKGE